MLEEVESGEWVYQGRNEFTVNCHIQVTATVSTVTVAALVQDIPENGADVAHLDAVHSASILLGGEPSQAAEEASSGLTSHVWDISWAAGEGEAAHTASISLHHKKLLLGRLTVFSLGVEAQQIGARLRGHQCIDTTSSVSRPGSGAPQLQLVSGPWRDGAGEILSR